ncbi:MAG: hypothetical protein LBI11_03475 [Streptococcaceae bacterium]|jgi:hypothetical protein|nr:hypothetical protein [Streptococcaceae bacterium]
MTGTWKAQDANGKNITITITNSTIKIGDAIQTYKYNGSENVSTDGRASAKVGNDLGIFNLKQQDIYAYAITTQDNNLYTIAIPNSNDKKTAILIKTSASSYSVETELLQGKMVYAMNKNSRPDYKYYSTKYLK